MHIGILTTWNAKCGIADYSEYLVKSFISRGEEVTIFGNHSAKEVHFDDALHIYSGLFGVFWWKEPTFLDKERIKTIIKDGGIDVLHIQYQSSLYDESLDALINEVGIPVVVTLHDSTLHSKHFKDSKVKHFVHHKEGIGNQFSNRYLIPYPYPVQQPKILSFGMGRNQTDIVKEVCDSLGYSYTNFDAREQDSWLNQKVLHEFIRSHDAVVLWYNEISGIVGNSFAARVALSCHRPVIVNDVSWFSDLPLDEFIKCESASDLKITLACWFNNGLMTFDKMAEELVERVYI